MSSATPALEISCAKPECHWRGSPADAPGHTCPTPAEAELEIDGEVVAEEDAAVSIAADADPTERADVEAWLLEHGNYDDQGIPQDEKTATIDARLVALQEVDPEPEPELDEIAETPEGEPVELPPAAEAVVEAEPEPAISDEEPDGTGGPDPVPPAENAAARPWETVIAEALESQTAVKEYRWLVVWKPEDATREAELIGRGKVKTEAVIIAEDVAARGQLSGEVAVEKTADVLKAAEEIEKRRELVEEPARVVETPAEPEPEPAPEPAPEPETPKPAEAVQEAAEKAQAAATAPGAQPKGGLFDASDYDREDLAIPKVDGHQIDRIALDFSGSVMLDRSEIGDVELYNSFALFKDRELWISAKATGTGAKGATNREGDLDVVMGRKTLRVDSVRIVKPEELGSLDALESLRMVARRAFKAGVSPDAIEQAVTATLDELVP